MAKIRPAKPQDIPGMARVRVETQKTCYRAFLPHEYLDHQTYETTEKKWRQMFWEENCGAHSFVAESEQGEIVGAAVCTPVMDPSERVFKGEIFVLYVLPAFQGMGTGRGLMSACVQDLACRNLTPILLWTFKEGPARRFYEALGGERVGEREVQRGGKHLLEVCYGWKNTFPLIESLEGVQNHG